MNNPTPLLKVLVQNKNGVVYDQNASAITSLNQNGVFDVLPRHANFISLIKDYLVLHSDKEEKKEIKFKQGILEVFNNKATVYLDFFSE